MVLHQETSGWTWCQAIASNESDARCDDRCGWVPHASLRILPAPGASAPPPSGGAQNLHPKLVCSICLEHLGSSELLWSLPCAHTFHFSCISAWLIQKSECPLCRLPVDGVAQRDSTSLPVPGESLRRRAASTVATATRRRRRRQGRSSERAGQTPAEQPRLPFEPNSILPVPIVSL